MDHDIGKQPFNAAFGLGGVPRGTTGGVGRHHSKNTGSDFSRRMEEVAADNFSR